MGDLEGAGVRLAVARNEAARRALLAPLRLARPWVALDLRRRIAGHARAQARLRARYGVSPATPILRWGPAVEAAVAAWAARQRGVRWAETSGSTARPKRLPFTRARLRAIRRGSWAAAVQAGHAHGVRRPGVFVLAGLERDGSLSSLLLDEPGRTPWLEGLVMPSKLLWEPGLRPLLERFDVAACRLWLLLLADPGFLYATNPSTLAVFLERLATAWDACAALARAHLAGAPGLAPLLRRVTCRVASPGWLARVRRAAEAPAAPPLEELLPGLRCYACWDGGYVGPFLERVRAALPAPRFAHVPMYSMSTETVQTTTWYDEAGRPRFLPLVPGVLYELLPEGAPDDPALLAGTDALEPGRAYALVVSDAHGLRRYQTDDLFLCAGRARGLPDLRFLRRQGLAFSFTGEKLTGAQVEAAFAALRAARPALGHVQLTLVPCAGGDVGEVSPGPAARPHYRLVLAWPGPPDPAADLAGAAAELDRLLGEQNREYAAKRASARLGAPRAVALHYEDLARRLGAGAERGWELQFKLLPLLTRTWEALGLAPAPEATP